MTVRKLNVDTGDIETSGTQFISGVQEVGQTIKTRLQLFSGEYFRDNNDGTDVFGKVFTKQGTLETKDAVIKQRIRQTKDVVQLLSYDADFDFTSREYSIVCRVLTTFGEIEINQGGLING